MSVDAEHEAESLSKRLEYVISIAVFVAISLIFPAMVGYKLIDHHEELTDKIKRLSEEDYLTKLHNRRKIHELLENEISRSKRYNSTFAVILLDIDNFKIINDTLGHSLGDKLIKVVANRFLNCIRKGDTLGRCDFNATLDTVARMGGDEFTILLSEIKKSEKLKALGAATFSGILTGFFPGLGAAQAAIIAMQLVGEISVYAFMVLIGGINTVIMSFSFNSL